MDRRSFIALMASMPLANHTALAALNSGQVKISKPIPSTGELLPVIGMGTWITFNVGGSQKLQESRNAILKRFFELGGGMIDSSPMYGSAQAVVGEGLRSLNFPTGLFSADKVWTRSTAEGRSQFSDMQSLWGLNQLDLVQIHNLVNWEAHLQSLRELKEEGQIRYIGITTSHGLRHEQCEKILEAEPLDFIQLTYNITHREVEQRLLPLALERGVAVIANRPLDGGDLFGRVHGKEIPTWAAEFGCENWAQFFLKYAVSHPAVTCAIPATSQVNHLEENMGACYGILPGKDERKKCSTM